MSTLRIARAAGTLGLLALAAITALASSCASPSDAPSRATSDILNGTPWSPYTQSTETWSRNVVGIVINSSSFCSGTLLRPGWVLTAGHCVTAGTDPSLIVVSHTNADGSTTSRSAVEVLRHPDEVNGTDVILLRIDPSIDTGVASVPLYSGTTASLVGQSVRCFGYGAIAVGGACTSNAQCPANTFCQYGNCLTPDDGTLRTAIFSITQDPVDAVRWYRFAVPNALGQMELPGDSGSSCTLNGAITGVDKAGNNSNYNRHTSVEAFREWVQSIVWPALVSVDNSAGTSCRAVGSSLTYNTQGAAINGTAGSLTVLCRAPRRTDDTGAFSNVVEAPRVWVSDRSSTGSVCCQMVATDSNGTVVTGPQNCSTGSSGTPQSIEVGQLPYAFTYASYSLQCSVPATTAAGSSSILGYRILQSRR